jgi:hypothetical protein
VQVHETQSKDQEKNDFGGKIKENELGFKVQKLT